MKIKRLVKKNVRSLTAYEASEIPCRVKLDANESPYGFRAVRSVKTNRYPDSEARVLRGRAARHFRTKRERILHGNGSDELIYYLVTAFGGPVIFPTPTFSMYRIIAQALDERFLAVPLDESFDIDLYGFLRVIKKRQPRLIFLSSPNNPTGNAFSRDRMERIIRAAPSLVVVDEAYQAYSAKKSFLPMIDRYPNLVILKTLSKVGLAGLRVGFLIARRDVVQEVNKVRLPFNLNAVSQDLAIAALGEPALMRTHIRSVTAERKRLFNALKSLQEVTPYPSDANFILFQVRKSDRIYRGLLRRGVLIRNMKGVLDGYLRVTVGTARENSIFLAKLRELLS